MADMFANLAATLALGPEEGKGITIPVYGQWVVTYSEDGDENEFKTVFAYEIDEEGWRQPLSITWSTKSYQASRGLK